MLKEVRDRFAAHGAAFAVAECLRSAFRSRAVPALVLALSLGFASPVSAQSLDLGGPIPLSPGDMAVSGFSGTIAGENADTTVIDPEGMSIKIFDVSNLGGPPAAQILTAPVKGGVKAKDIGQVSALAFDNAQGGTGGPFLYAGSTSAYGLHIVATDPGPDGKPVRLRKGAPGAKFMDGLFGREGSPGAIWKIDLATGKAGLLADTAFSGVMNSGPGIGDVAYDPKSRSVYASDLDTGLVHRFATDYNAADLGQYDHGVTGRPAAKFPPVPDDGKRADILSPDFDTAKPETWGFTQPERRVQALAVHDGRLFYSVADGSSVWSVGLNPDGGFGDDPRLEAAAGSGDPVTGIVFDEAGAMILAKRSLPKDPFDFRDFIERGGAEVLRLVPPEPGQTPSEPEKYAVGFTGGNQTAAGGVSLQYGYGPDGRIDPASCGQSIAFTGDALVEFPPNPADPAAIGLVHGVQLNSVGLTGKANTPPLQSAFLPFDANRQDVNLRGHIGDVAAFMPCEPEVAEITEPPVDWAGLEPSITNPPIFDGDEFPRDGFIGDDGPFIIEPPIVDGGGGGLDPDDQNGGGGGGKVEDLPKGLILAKKATATKCNGQGGCTFDITLTNNTDQQALGPITVTDTLTAGATKIDGIKLGKAVPAPWACTNVGPKFTCTHPGPIAAGAGISLPIAFIPGPTAKEPALKNCASATAAGGVPPAPEKCASIPLEPEPKLVIKKEKVTKNCTDIQACVFDITITNDGDGTFSGPLVISDTASSRKAEGGNVGVFAASLTTSLASGPNAPWNCVGGVTFTCTHPGVVLAKGGSVTLTMGIRLGKPDTEMQNCAAVVGPFGTPAVCVQLPLFLGPRIEVTKTVENPVCQKTCNFTIRVKNVGNAPFTEPVEVQDFSIGPIIRNGPPSAPWTCVLQTCTHPAVNLLPGQTMDLLTFAGTVLNNPVPPKFENCARGLGSKVVGGTSCVELTNAPPPPPPATVANLAVTKTPPVPATCTLNGPCTFTITVTNTGPNPYTGPIKILDEVSGGVPTSVAKGIGDWTCAAAGAGKLSCDLPNTTLAVNASSSFSVAVVPGPTWKKNDILKNCANVQYTNGATGNDQGANKADDQGCAQVQLDPFKLQAQKTGDQSCQPGGECTFNLAIFNPGPIVHNAPVVISDNISGVGSAQIVSINPPLNCPQQPTSVPFTCTTPVMHLEIGQRIEHQVVLKLPEGGGATSFSNCLNIAGDSKTAAPRSGAPAAAGNTGGASTSCTTVALKPATPPPPLPPPPAETTRTEPAPPPPPAAPPMRCAAGEVGVYPNCYKGSGGSNSVQPQYPDTTVEPPIQVRPGRCTGGRVGTPPNCRCPQGTDDRSGVCRAPPRECPRGTSGTYPNCRRDCPPGTFYENGVCTTGSGGSNSNRQPDETERTCPSGTSGQYPNCVRDCPTGTIYRNGVCMTRGEVREQHQECPPGTSGRYPRCRAQQQPQQEQQRRQCPEGTYGRYPRCRSTGSGGSNGVQPQQEQQQSRQCPEGMIGRYPRCRTPQAPQQRPQQQPDQVGPSPKPIPPPAPKECPRGLKGPNCDVLDVR